MDFLEDFFCISDLENNGLTLDFLGLLYIYLVGKIEFKLFFQGSIREVRY